MNWRCRILGHDGPWHLDADHPGHCRRCREPVPEWVKDQARAKAVAMAYVYGGPAAAEWAEKRMAERP